MGLDFSGILQLAGTAANLVKSTSGGTSTTSTGSATDVFTQAADNPQATNSSSSSQNKGPSFDDLCAIVKQATGKEITDMDEKTAMAMLKAAKASYKGPATASPSTTTNPTAPTSPATPTVTVKTKTITRNESNAALLDRKSELTSIIRSGRADSATMKEYNDILKQLMQ